MPELLRIAARKPNPIRGSSRDRGGAGGHRQPGAAARGRRRAARRSTARCARAGCTASIAGVYSAVAPELLTEEGHLIAALLAAGDGALLSHGTAAWRWRIIPAPPSVIQLAVPRARAGARGRACSSWAAAAARTTSPSTAASPRTSVAAHPPRPRDPLQPRRAPARARRSRVPARPAPRGHRAHPAPRAPRQREPARRAEGPRPRLRTDEEPAASAASAGSSSAIGIELPLRNQAVGPWTVDCLWPDRRVAVELDGRQHERPRQADSDDDRDLWLRRHGYVTRRYGKRQIDERPDDVDRRPPRRLRSRPRRACRSGCCRRRPGGRCPRRSARA